MRARIARGGLAGALAVLALALGAAASFGQWDEPTADTIRFAAWCAALALLFVLALRLPLRLRGPAHRAVLAHAGIAVAAIGVAVIANIALYRHDVHFDLTRAGRFTAPPELETIAASLARDVAVFYFYNAGDDNALAAKEALAALARRRPHLHLRAIDLDREPAAASAYSVRAYNTIIVESGERRVQVANTVDLRQVAFALLRALKQRTETVCFVTGHGEVFDERSAHVHFSHAETLQGHDNPGAEDVVVGPEDGLDRLKLALDAFGYAARAVAPAIIDAIPEDCAVVADIGPHRPYAPAEPAILQRYLARGGRLLLLYDPVFPVGPELRDMLEGLGLAVENAVVIDPVNHYGTEEDKIAIPYYPPHPITDRLGMTVFADARPLRILGAREGIAAAPLLSSSDSSWLRSAEKPRASRGDAKPGAAVLAVAMQGRADRTAQSPFRLVVAGTSSFARNALFPIVSNGELAVSMVRWLAGDMNTANMSPARYSPPEITLTHRQMQGVFVVVEILLPLSVALAGVVVWWRRR
jgi:hypothetical protein